MPTYSDDTLATLQEHLFDVPKKRRALLGGLYAIELRNPDARHMLEQGVMRRISLLVTAIEQLFRVLPPETETIPTEETRLTATLLFHSNVFNVFGLLDCWAHVWVSEFGILSKNGMALSRTRIGLGKSYSEVRNSFTDNLRILLESRDDWINHLSNLRHALAHRVPPYIPPHMVDPANEREYEELQRKWFNTLDQSKRRKLDREIQEISHFKAFILYDLDEMPPVAFHQQIIVDFLTIEEISYRFMMDIPKKMRQSNRALGNLE